MRSKLLGVSLLCLVLAACTSADAPASNERLSDKSLSIEGLQHPVPGDLIFETVMANRGWLGTFMCPEQTMLLGVGTWAGFSRADLKSLTEALKSDGCKVVENTPEMRQAYLNPATDEWRRERYKSAFIGSVTISAKNVQDDNNLSIEIGWYKGHMTAKSFTLLFRWDGSKWVKRTDLIIVTVS